MASNAIPEGFIGFEKAFDSIPPKKPVGKYEEVWNPEKIVRMVKIFYEEFSVR